VFDVRAGDRKRVAAILEAADPEVRKLPELDALALLDACGIPVAPARLAYSPAEVGDAAEAMAGPVALKVVAPAIVHKTDVGGVVLGIEGRAEASAAAEAMLAHVTRAAPDSDITGVLVQAMLPSGRDAIVGATRDPSFGPLIMVGLGGVLVEVLRDVSFRLLPVSRDEVRRMIRSLRAVQLFDGVRGMPPVDFAALEDAVLRMAWLMEEFPAIAEIDVNPLVLYPDGARAADARVMLDR
jgi:acyl-CoA synthetase (NDP forming)